MATANCAHLHAQLQRPWAHCEQLHEHHNAHWREHCAVLSTPRTVCRCTCVHTSLLWLKVSPCVSFHIIHAWALVSCCLSVLYSPVSLLFPQVFLPLLPDVYPGAWREFHGRSLVQLQLREHGQPGLCHTRHNKISFETIQVCIIVLCYQVVVKYTRSNAPSIWHEILSTLWQYEQVCSHTAKYPVSPYEPNTVHSNL